MLVSRTESKLIACADELEKKYKVKTKVLAVDYAAADDAAWAKVATELGKLDVAILINNIGLSYDYPEYLDGIDDKLVADLVQVNVVGTTKVRGQPFWTLCDYWSAVRSLVCSPVIGALHLFPRTLASLAKPNVAPHQAAAFVQAMHCMIVHLAGSTEQNKIFHLIREIVALQMIKAVLPGLKAKRKGVIVNVSSASAALLPSSPFLAVYAATKVLDMSSILQCPFVRSSTPRGCMPSPATGKLHSLLTCYSSFIPSQAYIDNLTASLAEEYRPLGVVVQRVAPLYVATKMSKIRRPRLDAPSPKTWVNVSKYIAWACRPLECAIRSCMCCLHNSFAVLVLKFARVKATSARWIQR